MAKEFEKLLYRINTDLEYGYLKYEYRQDFEQIKSEELQALVQDTKAMLDKLKNGDLQNSNERLRSLILSKDLGVGYNERLIPLTHNRKNIAEKFKLTCSLTERFLEEKYGKNSIRTSSLPIEKFTVEILEHIEEFEYNPNK